MNPKRNTYVYDEVTKSMVPRHVETKVRVHDIMPDLPDFVSTVDGSVIHGRAGLREHDYKHGTTNVADYTETWAKRQRQRELYATGQLVDRKRTEAVARAFNHLEEKIRNQRSR